MWARGVLVGLVELDLVIMLRRHRHWNPAAVASLPRVSMACKVRHRLKDHRRIGALSAVRLCSE